MGIRIVICLIAGYLFGSISTGYIIGKIKHFDIRNYGSGNAGTTNAFRTMGKAGGILTFIGDFFKAYIPMLLIKYVIWSDYEYVGLLMMVFGFACVIGHNYPVWLRFKGGKGIAVTGGVFVAMDPWILIPGFTIFGLITFFTKYVSLGSLAIAILFPIWLFFSTKSDPYHIAIVCIACLYTASAFYRHKSNIKRLMNGTENKIGQHVSVDKPQNS